MLISIILQLLTNTNKSTFYPMKEFDEGVIKFQYTLKKTLPLKEVDYIELEKWRTILFRMGLIGEYKKEKVGYGNISKRLDQNNQFIITGTQTGKFSNLDGSQYTKIVKCSLDKMSVEASGPIAPSSESITHFAIYQQSSHINYVFHVHHKVLWQYMIDTNMDSTPENIDYGTKEMAQVTKELIASNKFGIFVMKGHQDGIIAYGETCEDTGKILIETLKKVKNNP